MPTTEIGLFIFAIFIAVHGIGVYFKLYQKFDKFDIIAHSLGGLTVGTFIPNIFLAVFLFILWEIFETILTKIGRADFNETLTNKLRDVFFGIIGFVIGAYIL